MRLGRWRCSGGEAASHGGRSGNGSGPERSIGPPPSSPKLTEENRLQFRAEFFNLFNRPSFRLPEDRIYLSSCQPNPLAGEITATHGSARQIQFGLRFTF